MIEANKMLFDRLWTLVPERLTHFAEPATKRYVATTGDQQDFVKRATVHCNMELAPGFSGSIVQHPQLGRFAVLPGAGPVSFEATLPDLRVQACDAGWLTVLGSECDLRLSDEAGIGEQVLDRRTKPTLPARPSHRFSPPRILRLNWNLKRSQTYSRSLPMIAIAFLPLHCIGHLPQRIGCIAT
jgi:hypothetical protein